MINPSFASISMGASGFKGVEGGDFLHCILFPLSACAPSSNWRWFLQIHRAGASACGDDGGGCDGDGGDD